MVSAASYPTGSLLNDNVYERVTSRKPVIIHSGANLIGFKRRRVKRKPYPACIPSHDGIVIGNLIDASIAERIELDRFESDYYKRITVDVRCEDKQVRADLYIWNRSFEELDLQKDWSFEEFMSSISDQPFQVSFDDLQN